ncbi:polysaccharide lyase 8 family protein [Streptobacillus felis]|uniref:Polysaccharide lyase 8 family protein n=1 Tax=Streptobacillus felis TaxID=1384509 RepID=A0A7Z0TAQ3_9FUSO|nr:polysaccharide lyase 8 family protein [Streptobacillus felis]NYV28252.1 polysaccharide lyase 8 family protein [Streptobacillus felis]
MKKIIIFFTLILGILSFNSETKEIQNMKMKWKEFLLSVPHNISLKEISAVDKEKNLEKLNKSSKDILNRITVYETQDYAFKNYKDMNNGDHVLKSLRDVQALMKAYLTPGTEVYGDKEVKEMMNLALEIISNKGYVEGEMEKGNWWHWEIGIPKTLNELLIIGEGIIDKEIETKLLKASHYFQPDPEFSGLSPAAATSTSPNKRISTGGNRTDTALVTYGRGIIEGNASEIKRAIDSVAIVGEFVEKGDGFYKDHSFVQHGNVAYSGTYGQVLLNGLSMFIYLTGDTSFEINNPNINNVYEVIVNGYPYLLINGGINDSVNGRSISRDNSSDLERARGIINSLALISRGANKEYKGKIEALVKKAIVDNNAEYMPDFVNNLVIKNILKDIADDKEIKSMNVSGTKVFSYMDRAVSIGDNGLKFVVSMHSNRIANFETMNKENLKGWYTGDGMTYIYTNNSGDFIEYWPTINPLRLAGTTESTKDRTIASGERRLAKDLSPKTWVGGASNGNVAFVGMDFISWNNLTEVKKSYLLLNGTMVAMGSNIKSTDGEVITVVDNRINNDSANKLVYTPLKDTLIEKNIVERSGSFKELGGKKADIINKEYVELVINHGNNPENANYAYAVSDKEIKDIEILKLDEFAHIVKKDNLLAINSWTDNKIYVDGIEINNELSLIKETSDKGMYVTIADPNHILEEAKIVIDGKYDLEILNDNVVLENLGNKTFLSFKLKKNGLSNTVKLIKK